MYAFPCAQCGNLQDLTQLHSWSYSDPLCSPACAQQFAARRAGAPPPAVGEVFDRTIALLEETGQLVAKAAAAARKAQTGYRNAESYGSVGGGMIARTVFGAAASASQQAAESSDEWMKDLLWQIDQRHHSILREMMALQGHGHDVTQPLGPLVREFGGLVGASYGGLPEHLYRLHQYLAYLHQGVQNIRGTAR
jgi:hypothetical protein